MSGHVMVTLILEVLFRAFTYGVHATFITLLFPSENFGFLYGVSFLIGGLSGFLAIPLFDMSMGTLSGINSKPPSRLTRTRTHIVRLSGLYQNEEVSDLLGI